MSDALSLANQTGSVFNYMPTQQGFTSPLTLNTLANGGTNANLTAVNGGVVWSNATQFQISAAGTSGQFLTSNGAAAPTWTTDNDVSTWSGGTTGLTPAPATSGVVTLAGTLIVAHGGTGATTLTSNGVLFGNGAGIVHVTAQGAANTVLTGNAGAPTFTLLRTLNTLANGGTNANLTAVNGGVVYSTAGALAVSAAGTSGQVLSSAGAGTPLWISPPVITDLGTPTIAVQTTSTAIFTLTVISGKWCRLSLFVLAALINPLTLSINNATGVFGTVSTNTAATVVPSSGNSSPATNFWGGGGGGLWEIIFIPSSNSVSLTAVSATSQQNVTFGGLYLYT